MPRQAAGVVAAKAPVDLTMTLDPKVRKELLVARQNICSQLAQLEGAAVDPYDGGIAGGMMPDSRGVYADLQRELKEIDDLLEGDGAATDLEAESAYHPMVRWYADRTVGNPVRPTTVGIILGVISLGFFVFVLGLALFQAVSG
jgi:hypothetical protein